jgi:hypothetical protein
MKLVFKYEDNFEKTLAAARYQKFWEKSSSEILASFYKHTQLRFKQKKITIHMREDGRSMAGNSHQPMELSMQRDDEQGITCTLIHELAHRLVIGNGIDPPEGNKFIDAHANYYVHRHIYLFLYDVYVDILGKEVAQTEVDRESTKPNSFYTKAWAWALAKSYDQRQQSFMSIKRRYIHNL